MRPVSGPRAFAPGFVLLFGTLCCVSLPRTASGAEVVRTPGVPEAREALGVLTREQVEALDGAWARSEVSARPSLPAVAELAVVPAGAQIDVYFGTWCADSRRELGRLWRALDGLPSEPPFVVRYVAVSHGLDEPAALLGDVHLRAVPTFVVRRAGRELGRVVETSPSGIELDLLHLLRGEATGELTVPPGSGTPVSR